MSTPILAELIFANRQQFLLVLTLAVVSGCLLWLNYRRSILPTGARRSAVLLKTTGFILLAFCFLEPMWSSRTIKPGANMLVQLADNSQGMQITDRDAKMTRGEMLAILLAPPTAAPWQDALARDFQVRNYRFDSRLQRLDHFGELDFSGETSALSTSLNLLHERFKAKPLAGILLFTDGNLTDLPADPAWMNGLPPVFPVIIGSNTLLPDAAIQTVAITETMFEDAPVTVRAELQFTGLAGQIVTARVTHAEGETVQEHACHVQEATERQTVRFRLKPTHEGVSRYRLDLSLSPGITEATDGNNTHAITIDRGQDAHRILYVSGRPNWEYKFLRRALAEDTEVDLVGLIRMAKREPKFDFRGRSGETSNPLFRGFKDGSDEEAEQYDQTVLIRMNTRDEQELIGGFPKTAEELFRFQGLIIDDLEAAFFTPDQMALIERFVSFRGGGLLMLGGQESFHQGGYEKTPIGQLLPVYLDRLTEQPDYEPVRLDLTREGLLQPWIRLRETETAESTRLHNMPAFSVLNRLPAIKPGASVIAEVTDSRNRTFPAIAVQRFGRGQTGAITVGDLWRWGFTDEERHRDLAKTWRQVLRWLVKDAPRPVETEVALSENGGQTVRLEIEVRDSAFLPLDNAVVTCRITPPQGDPVDMHAVPAKQERGRYVCEYLPPANGHYKVLTTVNDPADAQLGRHATGWSINRNTREFAALQPNREVLAELARATGGEVVAPGDLDAFASRLKQREMPVMETWSRPAWHTPLLFLLALGCFVGEWGIRRKGGAA